MAATKKKLPRGETQDPVPNFCREESVGGNKAINSSSEELKGLHVAILTHPDDGHVVQRRVKRAAAIEAGILQVRPFGCFFNTGRGGVPQPGQGEQALERDLSGGDHSLCGGPRARG